MYIGDSLVLPAPYGKKDHLFISCVLPRTSNPASCTCTRTCSSVYINANTLQRAFTIMNHALLCFFLVVPSFVLSSLYMYMRWC